LWFDEWKNCTHARCRGVGEAKLKATMDPAKVGSTSSTMIFAIMRFRTLSNQWKVVAGRAEIAVDEGSANNATPCQNLEKQIQMM
jgi:hypothetical protein